MTAPAEPSAEPTEMTAETRQQLVSLYVRGDKSSAEALYRAWPGADDDGWRNMQQMLDPVCRFILDGEPYYVGAARRKLDSESYGADPLVPPADPPEWQQQSTTASNSTSVNVSSTGTTSTTTATGFVSAGELVDRARAATTSEELDEIESLANGRVTVIDAVAARRSELNL